MADAYFPAQLAQRNPGNAARFQRNFGGLEQRLAQITVMIRTRIRFQSGYKEIAETSYSKKQKFSQQGRKGHKDQTI